MAFKKVAKGQSGYDTQTWDKKTNSTIEGTYVEKKTNVQGKPGSIIYVLENEDGKWAVWNSMAIDEFMASVEIGTKVQISYLGQKTTSKGKTFNSFEFGIDDGK